MPIGSFGQALSSEGERNLLHSRGLPPQPSPSARHVPVVGLMMKIGQAAGSLPASACRRPVACRWAKAPDMLCRRQVLREKVSAGGLDMVIPGQFQDSAAAASDLRGHVTPQDRSNTRVYRGTNLVHHLHPVDERQVLRSRRYTSPLPPAPSNNLARVSPRSRTTDCSLPV
jgi:hypothetical protein